MSARTQRRSQGSSIHVTGNTMPLTRLCIRYPGYGSQVTSQRPTCGNRSVTRTTCLKSLVLLHLSTSKGSKMTHFGPPWSQESITWHFAISDETLGITTTTFKRTGSDVLVHTPTPTCGIKYKESNRDFGSDILEHNPVVFVLDQNVHRLMPSELMPMSDSISAFTRM